MRRATTSLRDPDRDSVGDSNIGLAGDSALFRYANEAGDSTPVRRVSFLVSCASVPVFLFLLFVVSCISLLSSFPVFFSSFFRVRALPASLVTFDFLCPGIDSGRKSTPSPPLVEEEVGVA